MNQEILENYPFNDIENKWQNKWQDSYEFSASSDKEKYYILEMFPYPSGNIHVGHLRNYTIGDVIARMKASQGYNVLHPMGWDSFGLPAENAAIAKNTHPKLWTEKNIDNMREQLKKIGLSYDWKQEIATHTPEYYKHEQKFFLDFLAKNIAYQKETYVNWDPVDNTVLANEQVIDGRGWRSGALIERKKLKGWFLKVTDYANELLTDLDKLNNWPNSVIAMQKKWLGKSSGALIDFEILNRSDKLSIYTTRPETIFGASFCAISPQHDLSLELAKLNQDLSAFIAEQSRLSATQEAIDKAEKLGFDTGLKVKHPFIEGKLLPLYVANFVLMEYGTGAIFACPAHDQRDFDFAKKYKLPITQVVSNTNDLVELEEAYLADGNLVNSDFLDGLEVQEAKKNIIEEIKKQKIGSEKINFRIRDWGISRQRYWGCPIPIIYCDDCGAVPVPEEDLPVKLPEDNIDFKKVGNPLDHHESWKYCKCPKCNKDAIRETDTFDTFFESSWYFFRFIDSANKLNGFSAAKANKYLPVDKYIGGIEHAILHLLYARFFTKALRDCNKSNISEPFKSVLTQGMVTHMSYKDKMDQWVDINDVSKNSGEYVNILNGEKVFPQRVEKMSKSKKNGLSPIEIIKNYGADTARLFMLSDSPPEKDLEWSDAGLDGAFKYLNKIWRVTNKLKPQEDFLAKGTYNTNQQALLTIINKTIRGVTNLNENFQLNKSVAKIRELSNFMLGYQAQDKLDDSCLAYGWKNYAILLFPIAPHLSAEIFSKVSNSAHNIEKAQWPIADPKFLDENNITIIIQINGKLKAKFKANNDISKDEQEKTALEHEDIIRRVKDLKIKKVITIPKKIVNIVAI
ncbi:MAG: leucine--tRNA ligase [Alphaproteobacteria bacterium]|jgi:leucyl-tRNA synthetase|nr:leucine--tRNA ligase [Alphaproteobacteria bacterium]